LIGILGMVATGAATVWLSFSLKRMKTGGTEVDGACPSAQRFLGFEDVRQGIVILPGGRYRLILEVVGNLNWRLLSDAEQNGVEDAFSAFLASLSFPVQFYVQTRLLDLSAEIVRLQAGGREDEHAALGDYRRRFCDYLARWMGSQNVLLRKGYVVIPYDGPGDFELAKRELAHRKEIVEGALRGMLSTKQLSTEEVVDLLYVLYNKERAVYAKMRDAAEFGFLEPCVKRG
ncbi:MAG: hypothetical protein ACPLRM_04045, partial [Anaerolineae bacterium]